MNLKKITSVLLSVAVCCGTMGVFASNPGDSVKVGDYPESAKETQALIDNRPDIQRRMENIDRGTVAMKTDNGVFVSWRWLGYESADTLYNVYRDGIKINQEPLNATCYMDLDGTSLSEYSVLPVGQEDVTGEKVKVWENGYIEIPVQPPTESKKAMDGENEVEMNTPYSVCELSVADLDGDGQYEYIVKWDPAYVRDASKAGFTGDCVIDAYEIDGTLMWRINMGKNIRSGPHDTQFIVYDFDNDGMAEMACRTADGTVAGDGTVIGDATKDWAALDNGKNLQGPLYLTVFNGIDGSVMDTVLYDPQTFGEDYDLTDWGDSYGNRSERYLASMACVDGEHTSFQMARGYYGGPEGPLGGRSVVASYHVEDKKIVRDWIFDTKENGNKYFNQGNHSMAAADIDYDGLDEIIYGALVLDHDGTIMYCTGLGHGDAQHTGDLLPSRPGLETFSAHEWKGIDYVYEMRDARTGEILLGGASELDNGRGCTADIDPRYEGEEVWSLAGILSSADGTVLSNSFSMPINYAIWWDGDLGRELQDDTEISKVNTDEYVSEVIFRAEDCHCANGGKANSALTADIFGDWREETIYATRDNTAIRIFVSTEPTSYRLPTLMHDPLYRNYVALQNVCYNQPAHTSYYIGYDMENVPVPQMYVVDDNGNEVRNPDLEKKSWSINDLYSGSTQELVIGATAALVNGKAVAIDASNAVSPYINDEDRTMVPLRFIAESFGAKVSYDNETRGIEIVLDDATIKLTVESAEYRVNGTDYTMDTVPVIKNDRTMIPVRAVAEAFGKNVTYDSGLITISDIDVKIDNAEGRIKAIKKLVPHTDKYETSLFLKVPATEIVVSNGETNTHLIDDGDLETSIHLNYGDTVTIKAGSMSAGAMSYSDGKEHTFSMECSGDGENWFKFKDSKTVATEKGEIIKMIIGITKYQPYLRYTCLDTDGCDLSELAVIGICW